MVVDVGVEVKGGVLQYPLREEDTMGRETEHERPLVEYANQVAVPDQQTIGVKRYNARLVLTEVL